MQKCKESKKLLIFVLVAIMVMSLATGCAGDSQPSENNTSADNETIDIGYVNWAECIAVSNLWKVILEDQGYDVKLTQLDVAPLFVGLSKGDIDIFMDSWLPITHESYLQEYKDKLDDYGSWYQSPAKIGLVVPKYVTIDSIEQMKDEGEKFNNEIIGIDPGAGIMKAASRANETYDLNFKIIQGSEAAMVSALNKAYAKNEWIAITGWSPHWKFAKYDLKYLEDPKMEFGEAEEIHTLANKNFSNSQPEIAAMLKKFKMSDSQIGSLEGLIDDGMDPVNAAKKWIEDNQDTVDEWIK
ncbi:MAG: glycine betaine ABC transporter substrate-binding protein [Anaerovoracaceae bacterium]|jgi:glycine betaine/proline transport system substrate-binding protein